jgi:SynChlorMet cassette radical SAM/SPASM protein ScmE
MQVPKTPQLLDLSITARCNLRCRYCYHFTGPGDVSQDLPTADWLRFFEELGRLAVLRVGLEGGEPFMRPDLPELVEGIVRNRMRFHILTNGTLITDEAAKFLAHTRRCDYVQVSLDGPRPEIHEVCRGTGTFSRALAGLDTLRRHGVPVTVRMTLTPFNVEELPAMARFLLEDLGLPSFSTNAAGFLGQCRTRRYEVQLSVAERTRAMALLWELEQKYPGRLVAQAGPLANVRTWTQVLKTRERGGTWDRPGGYLVGCNCVFGKLAVRADGAVIPCTMLAHLELGHIHRDDLGDIWLNHPVLLRLRARRRISLHEFEFCRDCAFVAYCTGSCPGVTYNHLGTLDHPNPDDCLQRFLAEGGRLPHVQP